MIFLSSVILFANTTMRLISDSAEEEMEDIYMRNR